MKTKSILLAALLCSAGYQSTEAVQVFSWEVLRTRQYITVYWAHADAVMDEFLIQNADNGSHILEVGDPSISDFYIAVTDGVDNRVGIQQVGPGGIGGNETNESLAFGVAQGSDLFGIGVDYFQVDVGPTVRFSGHTYDAPVPDGGATIALLGLGLVSIVGLRRHFSVG